MATRPIGADDVTGELPGVVETRIAAVVADAVGQALWTGTQAEYDALSSYDAETIYITTDGTAIDPAPRVKVASTDGSFGLPLPSGVGFEWIFTDDALDGPYMNGVAL